MNLNGSYHKFAFLTAGLILVGIGIIGIFIPLLPTTIFLIIAAACFARSSPRLEAWLLNHPRLGPPVLNWRTHGTISRASKITALFGMISGYGLWYYGVLPAPMTALLVAAPISVCAIYVISRPESPRNP